MQALSFFLAAVMLPMDAAGADLHRADVDHPLQHPRTMDLMDPGVMYQSELQLINYIYDRLELAEGLSPGARNLTVSTTWHTVRLRGNVATLAEKKWVMAMARQEASISFRVIDEVTVGP